MDNELRTFNIVFLVLCGVVTPPVPITPEINTVQIIRKELKILLYPPDQADPKDIPYPKLDPIDPCIKFCK